MTTIRLFWSPHRKPSFRPFGYLFFFAGLLTLSGCKSPGLTKGFTFNYPLSIGLMMSNEWDQLGLSGKGIRVGVIDEGFKDFRADDQTRGITVRNYRNFVTNDTTNFFKTVNAHGTVVARNLGGKNGAEAWGLAYASDYYLAVSENTTSETKDEERNMIRAIRWMLDQGVRVINISLSYRKFDDGSSYGPADLYKASTISGRYIDSVLTSNPAVNFVIAIGNDGFTNPPYLGTPADVRYAITVTSTNEDGTKEVASASEGVPTAPYIKPDVGTWPNTAGTSFAAPAIAGLVAQMLEKNPTLTNKQVLDLLHRSGSKAQSPDYKLGYGVPSTAKLAELMK